MNSVRASTWGPSSGRPSRAGDHGCAEPVTYGDGLADRLRALVPDGVDVALDVAGNGILPELIGLAGGDAKT